MLIAARNGMAVKPKWKNPYVTDGLVAMWDGEWNAGGGVHDSTTTMWVDIVAENNFSNFVPGVSWGNKYIHIPGTQNAATALRAYTRDDVSTIECVCKPSGYNGQVLMAFANGPYGVYRWVGFRANATFNFETGGTAASMGANPTTLQSFVGAYNGAWTLYRNGTNAGSLGRGMTWNGSSITSATINRIASSYGAADIYCVRLYSRALTSGEIAANYAVDKLRFNLGSSTNGGGGGVIS